MNQDQKEKLFGVLRLLLLERNQQRDRVEAIERLIQETPELAARYETVLAEVKRNPASSIDVKPAFDALRESLFPQVEAKA